MSSAENRQQTFPVLPPSHSAGDHEMRDYYDALSAPRPTPNQTPYLTPYLGLRARLSQIWINRWTVLLLLVLVRTLFAIASMNNGLASARSEALSACTDVEKIGSAMASMPHYMSQGVNTLTATGIEKTVNGLMDMIMLTVTGVEEIVVFVIGMMTNTYLCLITLAVSGSLHAAVDLLQNAQNDLNGVLGSIGNDISGVASDIQKGINGLAAGVNTFLGDSVPKIDFSKEINELKNVTLPGNLTADLQKLNGSIPTFDEVKNLTDTVIRLPFEELKNLINSTFGNYTFNQSLFPVPQKTALTFCSDNNSINQFFDKLVTIARIARRVFLGVLLTLAILICLPMAWWEIRRYQRLQERAKKIGDNATDPMDAVYMASRPYTSDVGSWIANRFSTPRRRILVRWAVAYPTSIPALFILSLAITGLFACLCQYILLKAIEKEVPALTNEVANFTAKVVTQLNSASTQWSTGTNQVLMSESQKINQDLLNWVNISTTAVNNTLNQFVDETTKVLNSTFGGTPLYGPIQGVFDCLVGLKVLGLEKGLTWVHDHAHIDLPLLPNDTFSLGTIAKLTDGNGDDNLLANPSSAAQDDISAIVLKVTNTIAKGIRQEAIISTMILVVWLIIFAASIIHTVILFNRHDRVRGDAGNEYDSRGIQQDPYVRPMSAAPPYTTSNPDVNSQAPYSLNPHPFPRHDSDEEEMAAQKNAPSNSSVWPFRRNLSFYPSRNAKNQYNEKSGFI